MLPILIFCNAFYNCPKPLSNCQFKYILRPHISVNCVNLFNFWIMNLDYLKLISVNSQYYHISWIDVLHSESFHFCCTFWTIFSFLCHQSVHFPVLSCFVPSAFSLYLNHIMICTSNRSVNKLLKTLSGALLLDLIKQSQTIMNCILFIS